MTKICLMCLKVSLDSLKPLVDSCRVPGRDLICTPPRPARALMARWRKMAMLLASRTGERGICPYKTQGKSNIDFSCKNSGVKSVVTLSKLDEWQSSSSLSFISTDHHFHAGV